MKTLFEWMGFHPQSVFDRNCKYRLMQSDDEQSAWYESGKDGHFDHCASLDITDVGDALIQCSVRLAEAEKRLGIYREALNGITGNRWVITIGKGSSCRKIYETVFAGGKPYLTSCSSEGHDSIPDALDYLIANGLVEVNNVN